MSATSEEDKSNAAVQLHIAHFEFPADHLAPWGSILDKPQVAGIAALKNIADVGTELSRREWLDAHPGEPIPEKMESAHPDNEDGDEEGRAGVRAGQGARRGGVLRLVRQ